MKFLTLCIAFTYLSIASIPLSNVSENPRDDNSQGKLEKMQDERSDASSAAFAEIIVNILISSPELFFGSSTSFSFAEYPFEGKALGIYSEYGKKSYAFHSNISYLYESPQLQGLQIKSHWVPYRLLSFDFRLVDFTENFQLQKNDLKFLDLALNFQRLRNEIFNFRWGIGIKSLIGDITYVGPLLNLAADLHIRPLSFNIQYKAAQIPQIGFFNDLYLGLNYHFGNKYIFGGYQYDAGAVSINSLTIGIGLYL